MFAVMSTTTIAAWREHFNLSRNEVIRRTGLAKNTVYNAEATGLAQPGTLIAIANAFGISVSELLTGPPGYAGKPTSPAVRKIPLYEGVPVAGWERGVVRGTIDVLETKITDPAMVAVVVGGDRMFPTIAPNDVVLVDPTRTTPADGEIVCVVDRRSGKGRILRCRRMRGRILLVGDNPEYPRIPLDDPENIKIMGTVVRLVDRDLSQESYWPAPSDVSPEH